MVEVEGLAAAGRLPAHIGLRAVMTLIDQTDHLIREKVTDLENRTGAQEAGKVREQVRVGGVITRRVVADSVTSSTRRHPCLPLLELMQPLDSRCMIDGYTQLLIKLELIIKSIRTYFDL